VEVVDSGRDNKQAMKGGLRNWVEEGTLELKKGVLFFQSLGLSKVNRAYNLRNGLSKEGWENLPMRGEGEIP